MAMVVGGAPAKKPLHSKDMAVKNLIWLVADSVLTAGFELVEGCFVKVMQQQQMQNQQQQQKVKDTPHTKLCPSNIRVKYIYFFICYFNEILIVCSIVIQQSIRIEFLR